MTGQFSARPFIAKIVVTIGTHQPPCDDKITALEKEITSLNELFQTLLEQLMTGKLSARHLTHPIVRSNRFSGESEDG